MLGEVEADVFPHRQGVQQPAGLEDHCQAIMFENLRALDQVVVDEDFARLRLFESDDMPEEDALPTAAGTHDDEDFAGSDFQINAPEDLLAVEAFAQGMHADADAALVLVCGNSVHTPVEASSGSGNNPESQ